MSQFPLYHYMDTIDACILNKYLMHFYIHHSLPMDNFFCLSEALSS